MESVALRPRAGLTAVVFALAVGAWVLTLDRMAGMDAAPGADLGGLGWFAVSWLLMMAAMMLPSLVPALPAGRPSFVAGYLGVWAAAGLAAYVAVEGVRALDVGVLAWERAGRYVAAGAVLAAGAYQLTAVKVRCLDRCRAKAQQPRAVDGVRHGASCVGCCAGLMAALFALGVMNPTWMVAMAALITAERLLPWRTAAIYGVAATLAVLGIWVALAPADLLGLTLPTGMGGM